MRSETPGILAAVPPTLRLPGVVQDESARPAGEPSGLPTPATTARGQDQLMATILPVTLRSIMSRSACGTSSSE